MLPLTENQKATPLQAYHFKNHLYKYKLLISIMLKSLEKNPSID